MGRGGTSVGMRSLGIWSYRPTLSLSPSSLTPTTTMTGSGCSSKLPGTRHSPLPAAPAPALQPQPQRAVVAGRSGSVARESVWRTNWSVTATWIAQTALTKPTAPRTQVLRLSNIERSETSRCSLRQVLVPPGPAVSPPSARTGLSWRESSMVRRPCRTAGPGRSVSRARTGVTTAGPLSSHPAGSSLPPTVLRLSS